MGFFEKLKIWKRHQRERAFRPQTAKNIDRNQTITLANANQVTEFPFRVFVVVGQPGTGKTTLIKKIKEYYERHGVKVVEVAKVEDLENEKCVLLIDDLKEELTKAIFSHIVERFREVRHRHVIIVLSHQLLDSVPQKLLQLSEKVIVFNSKFNANQAFSKINLVVPRSVKHRVQEVALGLPKYQYVTIKNGKVTGAFNNLDVNPILGDTQGKEITLMNPSKRTVEKGDNLVLSPEIDALVENIPEWQWLSVTKKIIRLKQLYKDLPPRAIAKIVNTTPATVWTKLSQARSKGLLHS